LIVNGDGRMFRVPLEAPDLVADRHRSRRSNCNNDHGVSPDGDSRMVISDSTNTGPVLHLGACRLQEAFRGAITGGSSLLVARMVA
jgi:hypothetical protein